ncbi:MAG: 50S ribosomal protein L4 [Alphaproteobacteria bacterium CG_4_9_14_3_um_filter_47_13]|nr:MAG: 50S ribosomal protein L4 [Alphaproteobacteria bacterium CG_4_9_14_3_um_filter_47_13]
MKVAVKNIENKAAGEMTLDDSVFGVEVKDDVIHRMVQYQLNKRRSGNHKVKTRAEVSGTGKKPWKQKGTGRARAGDLKRPQDVGGGVSFGPVVCDHSTSLPKKIRALAMRMVLSSKAAEGKLVILDEAKAKDHKTKPMALALGNFGFGSALIVGGNEIDVNFVRATANIPKVDVLSSVGANVYDILRRDMLILTKDAVSDLTERLKD